MGYKDPARQRAYQNEWIQRRRREWFKDKTCALCGSAKDLRLDHRDPTIKVTHRIWSWSQERREAELAKCQVLCLSCHRRKTAAEARRGSRAPGAKLTEAAVRLIRVTDVPGSLLAAALGVSKSTVYDVREGRTWQHVA
jgi:hypothetical protein